MAKIVVIQGHPDGAARHLCHSLADAYISGAKSAHHDVFLVEPAKLDFPILRTQEDWMEGIAGTPKALQPAQTAISCADHLVLIYPLWMGTMPALLNAFLEQVFRPGVALDYQNRTPRPLLTGKSARVIVTMGMPAFAYRWYFLAHSYRSLKRSMLGIAGVRPVKATFFGGVESADQARRAEWLASVHALGSEAR